METTKANTTTATTTHKPTNTHDANVRNRIARTTPLSVLNKLFRTTGNPHIDDRKRDLVEDLDRIPSVAVNEIDATCKRVDVERDQRAYAHNRLTKARKAMDDVLEARKKGQVVPVRVEAARMAQVAVWEREYDVHKRAHEQALRELDRWLKPFGDTIDLVQVAHVAIQELHAQNRDIDSKFTVAKTNRKVYVNTGDVYETERETMGRREMFRAVRDEIAYNGNGEIATCKYTYLEDLYRLANGDDAVVYRRLPLYADVGGYATDANGKRVAYTADEQTVADVDALISALALTPIQADVLNCLRDGRGNKSVARRLKITENTVKSARREIKRKAAKYYHNAIDADGVPVQGTLLDAFADVIEPKTPIDDPYMHATSATVNGHTITFTSVDDVHKRSVRKGANVPTNGAYTWDRNKREWIQADGRVTTTTLSPAELAKYRK